MMQTLLVEVLALVCSKETLKAAWNQRQLRDYTQGRVSLRHMEPEVKDGAGEAYQEAKWG